MAHPRGAAALHIEIAELSGGEADAALSESWDAWLASAGAQAGFAQTSHWACISRAVNRSRSLLVTLSDEEGALRGGCLLGVTDVVS